MTHPWNLTPTEAVALQRELREQVDTSPWGGSPRTIGGADISYNKFSDVIYAAIVVLDYATQEVIHRSMVHDKMTFPYVPGLLSFREIPSLMKAWNALEPKPDLMMMDGHGIAHPRRIGIATHFGLLTGVPTIGCGKTVLLGKFEEPGLEKGSYSPMIDQGETVAYALRTKNKVKPVYTGPGNGLSLEEARDITLHCARGYRIPEPTRQAHLLANALRRGEETATAE